MIVLLWLLAGAGAVVSMPDAFDDAFRSGVALLVGHPLGLTDLALLLFSSVSPRGLRWCTPRARTRRFAPIARQPRVQKNGRL